MWVEVLYFASLREQAGVAGERVETQAHDLRSLYDSLRAARGLSFPIERLRASMDGAFAAWDTPLREGAEVAFLPPVSGG
jgi:molybdopterin synthase sulfur carrier subunit